MIPKSDLNLYAKKKFNLIIVLHPLNINIHSREVFKQKKSFIQVWEDKTKIIRKTNETRWSFLNPILILFSTRSISADSHCSVCVYSPKISLLN